MVSDPPGWWSLNRYLSPPRARVGVHGGGGRVGVQESSLPSCGAREHVPIFAARVA